MSRLAVLGSGLAGLIVGAVAVYAAAPQRSGGSAATEKVVHDYLLGHPEIIPEAMDRLQAKRTKAAVDADRAAIERPFAGAWAGAKDADVTLVEFTDYACGYCRKSVPDIDRLLAEDRKLRVVWREIPILSPESEVAARVALAAAASGKYAQVHHGLFAGGQLSDAKIGQVAQAAGLPTGAADDPKVHAEIQTNVAIAQRLGVNATPTFVIGDQVTAGAVGYDALKAAIAAARKRG